jgi:hypothetical protein
MVKMRRSSGLVVKTRTLTGFLLNCVRTATDSDVFDDLGKLREDLAAAPQHRALARETFARVPHDKALALNVSGTAWRVLIEARKPFR